LGKGSRGKKKGKLNIAVIVPGRTGKDRILKKKEGKHASQK